MSEEIKTLKLKRETLKSQLDRFDKYFNSIQDVNEQSVAQMQLRLEKLEPSFEEFNVIQTQIEILTQDKSDEVPLSEYVERNSFEENFFEVITNAKLVVSNFREKKRIKSREGIEKENNEQTQVKLPIIKLPTFGGVCNQWLEFRDAFTALVHDNKTISDIQKYYYMKSALEGEASHLIQSIAVSVANYKIAWDLLCERYENKTASSQPH
ncbi:uncharacterized protein LOC108905924 [Anoplophora glabripennis]|uniref:uncharacterized protein LOC108905924 n=1 Tax=Anoplophora glabripennis TaxID=217634 RepID=UPI0008756526|nr:uncharacterized protein LOC108905924 [Anoplophora glabripennis]